jgi:leucyl aminopeptidase (aminopeptidase T)
MRATDRAVGIRNYVVNWAEVSEGEEVIVVADSYADEDVVNEVAAEARSQGANVVVTWIDFNPIQAQGGGPIIDEALQAADKMLRLTFATSHDRGTQKAIMEHGLEMYSVANPHDPEFFAQEAAEYPVELVLEIEKKALSLARSGSEIHVTCKKGTDVTATYNPEDWGGDFGTIPADEKRPGTYPATFPGAIAGVLPPQETSGVVYYDAFSGVGVGDEPIKLTFEDNFCTNIEGGRAADELNDIVEGVPNVGFCEEFMFGLHPKVRDAPLDQKPIPNEAERRYGNIHIAIGNMRCFSMYPFEETGGTELHLDGFVLDPTIEIDGEPVVEDSELTFLDDPDIREVAAEHGDPDKLLTQK